MKIIVERKRPNIFSQLKGMMFLNVFAEEHNEEQSNGIEEQKEEVKGNENPGEQEKPTPKPSGSVNFEELIAKARKEERDKLYPQIEKLKKDKNDLLLVVAERDKQIAEYEKAVNNLQKEHSKMSKDVEEGTKTNKIVQEQSLTISQLEQELEELQAKYEMDIQSLQVQSYRDKMIASAGGELIPELVTGNTEEEINASIELAKQKYAEIQEKALASVQMPKPANPSISAIQNTQIKSIDDIRTMTPQEWAEARKTMGLK